jgi:murein DD-endopeptidase MepM/ murein hydrolase activator NlpD
MKISKRFLKIIKVLLIIVLILVVAVFVFFSISTSVTKNIDSYEYNLPFEKGARYRVVQGYGGLFSHKHIAALDFAMPVGTPVCAAREGTIYAYKDDSDEGGPFAKYKNKANYLIIKHDDGSFGCYWHLQKNGVLIKNGRVSKGQQIAISGATGLVFRSHLHFSVKLKLNYEMNSFTRTKFKTTRGVILLERGKMYERPAAD